MPQKINMYLSNGNLSNSQISNIVKNNSNLAAMQKNTPSPTLNTSMISRIHNVKPGCGSCGR